MFHDQHSPELNFKFGEYNLFDEFIKTILDVPFTGCTENKKKDKIEEKQVTRPLDVLEQSVSPRILLLSFKIKLAFF